MAKWIGLFLLLGIVLTANFAGAIWDTDAEVEYSRITLGGGHSTTASYQVDDSLTQNLTSTSQKSSRYEVVGIKDDAGAGSGVNGWNQY